MPYVHYKVRMAAENDLGRGKMMQEDLEVTSLLVFLSLVSKLPHYFLFSFAPSGPNQRVGRATYGFPRQLRLRARSVWPGKTRTAKLGTVTSVPTKLAGGKLGE